MNRSYIAHIIADSPGGPRGDPILSPLLASNISNLMLLCDAHHRLIDIEQVAEHSVVRLAAIKKAHEERIEIVTGIAPEKRTEVLLYGANIGAHSSPINIQRAVQAIIPDRYPASTNGIALGMINSAATDHDDTFWRNEAENLRRLFNARVKQRLAHGDLPHLSVFALAPQPLLVLLGSLLSDIPAAEVYQLHREPPDWKWQDAKVTKYQIKEPSKSVGSPVVILSLSTSITIDRITSVMKEPHTIWVVTTRSPNNDFLKSKAQLHEFRRMFRQLLDRIKLRHGENVSIYLFPAVPVAIAVEVGRVWMPKADLPIIIYDQNRLLNGFTPALDIKASKPNEK